MFSKINFLLLASIVALLVALMVMLSTPVVASAAPMIDATNNSCLTCHEDLYYLHDTGKWYCITEHKDHCADCHEGNASTLNKGESHQGLIAHPQKNNGEKCQQCHSQDSQAHLAKFASLGGSKTIIETESYIPSRLVTTGLPKVSEPDRLAETRLWLVGGVFAFALWLVLVLISPMKP